MCAILQYFDNISDPSFYLQSSVLLTCLQKEIIVGTLLGDSSLERDKPTHNTRIRFDQSYPNHKSYLESLYVIFANLCGTPPRVHTRKPDERTGKIYQTIAFKSLRHISLNYYYNLFYVYDNNGKRRKIVPNNITELLTPCALAYWIMDDGGINTYNATILNTDSFTLEEVERLQKALEQKFGLRTRKAEKRKGQWVIIIPVRQTVALCDIVRPYMHETMLFKVKGLN